MKKIIALFLICMLCLSGCSGDSTSNEKLSDKYSIGDEIYLAGIKFNIYKIKNDSNEICLLAKNDVATTTFSAAEREQKYMAEYEGSLIEGYVNEFVDGLEDKGLVIKDSGLIEKDDLVELGFESDGLNGARYKINDSLNFISKDDRFWVGGYSKYDTMAWTCSYGIIEVNDCDKEYGVRPVITIDASEVDKELEEPDPNLTVQDMVNDGVAWLSEGGIHNPYDKFYFDCEQMIFTNIFESSELSNTYEYAMEFIDDKTIRIEGFGKWYQIPAELTIVNENKLRLRFIDNEYNDGDYFLIKTTE